MTREQETTCERLTGIHGWVLVREYDDHVRVTTPAGQEYRVSEAGTATESGFDHTVHAEYDRSLS